MKSVFFTFFIIFSLAGILVFNWFKDGYILGTVESQIPFYNITGFYDQVKFAWSENNPGLGFANGIVTAFSPTFAVLSYLEKIGIPNYIIEAFFFLFCLTSAGLGITLLTQELFPHISKKYLLIAPLFYWFNALSLVNIWNRFLYNYIALWALLPLAAAFYIKGIRKKNFLYVFITGIICSIFSLGLSNPVFNILLWSVLIFITIFHFIISDTKKDKLFNLFYFAMNLGYFCLINLWWIGQVVRYAFLGKYSEEIAIFFPFITNLATLDSLSQSLGNLTYLFRLMHKSFFADPIVPWASMFAAPAATVVESLITGIILLILVRGRKNINVLFLGLFFISSLYLTKGSSGPLGDLFRNFFERFTILQLFRNPFEKFGFLIPLAVSPLLAVGLEDLSSRFQKKFRWFLYITSLAIIVGFLGFPFWSGLVFTNAFPPTDDYSVGYKVKVPDYYREASDWLASQGQNFRFLGFPSTNQGITYKWEKGYQGIETTMWLFSTPNITFTTTLQYFDKASSQLEKIFMTDPNFYKVMNILNAKYLMVRSDVDYQERNIRDPKRVTEIADILAKEGKLRKATSFNNLNFWENSYWSDKTIYIADSLIKATPEVKLADFTLPEVSTSAAAYQQSKNNLDKMVNLEIVHPVEEKEESDNLHLSKFEIKKTGSYELIVNSPIVRIDKKEFLTKATARSDERFSYGNLEFSEGSHEIEQVGQISDNLAVPTQNSNEYSILDFDPFSKYFISYEYFLKDNQKGKLMIYQDNDQIRSGLPKAQYTRDLSEDLNSFKSDKDIYQSQNTATNIKVSFSPELKGKLLVRNMNVKKITKPEIMLISRSDNPIKQVPTLTYTKISPTKYRIQIKGSRDPFILVFSSVFNSGWEITYSDGSKVSEHFLANSFANGWLVDRVGDQTLTLNFSLQDSLEQDSFVSKIAFIVGVLILLITLLRRRLKFS